MPGLVVGHTCAHAPTQVLTRRKSVPQSWEVRDLATGETWRRDTILDVRFSYDTLFFNTENFFI